MNTTCRIGAAMFAWLGAVSLCAAQEVQWKQTIDVPQGQSIPRDRADILGIELGDSIDTVRSKMSVLLKEANPKESNIEEQDRVFQFRVSNSSSIMTASYVNAIVMTREMPGKRPITDKVTAFFSAPASGQQLIGIERSIIYDAQADQPLISEILAQVKQKMGSAPEATELNETANYVWQFDGGRPVPRALVCSEHHGLEEERELPTINPSGSCDALFTVKFNYGISRDHAEYVQFVLSDVERTRLNLTADFAYVHDFIHSYQAGTRGAAPKL